MTNKSLGQHWLRDSTTLASIVAFADVTPIDTVLEIGPGPGTLTEVLIGSGAHVVAVEYDGALAAALVGSHRANNLHIMHGDILQFDFSTLPIDYKVVANIPYYISSKIVRLLMENRNPPKAATLLVQQEVAERLAAEPGEMSLLAVSAQFYANVRLGPIVPKELFSPMPRVESRVVRLDYHGPRFPELDVKMFFRVVKAGFAERRKKLRSSLSGGLHMEKDAVDSMLLACGIAAEARAQELSLEQWRQITEAVEGMQKGATS